MRPRRRTPRAPYPRPVIYDRNIMKLTPTLLFVSIALVQNAATAQAPATAPAKPATHVAAPAHAAAATHTPAAAHTACAKLPELSPKIPALPAGAPCAKPLFTLTTVAPAKLSDVSSLEIGRASCRERGTISV